MTRTDADQPTAGAEAKDVQGIDASRDGWSFNMMLDPRFASDPRPFYADLRDGCPVRDDLDVPGHKPTVLVSRFQDVEQTLRNPQQFSSRFGEGMGGLGNDRPLIPLQIDPPDHKKYRVLLDPFFAPRKMALLEPDVAVLVNQMIDGFADRGECDFTAEFAVPLPCTVFLRLMGLPLEDLDFFLRIKDGIIRGNREPDLLRQAEARASAGRQCYEYFERHLDELEREKRPGLLGDLLDAEVDGIRLTRDEILDICYLMIIAGLDTVTDSLCCFWSHLASHPAHRQRIVEEPEVIPAVVEELLRWESPVSGVARMATEDTDLSGCPVRKGDNLLVFVGAANTDPEGIPDADKVDFDRATNKHYAFGGGIHRCLGSHLARMELRVALREWHRRIPEYTLEEGCELVWTPMLRACERLPLVFSS
ncbi:MAG TPA: cytochrome P450 [Acidimicrobiales bacterium]|nr:cytochrome P450 [Acidimicrobiales bacterium]